MIHIRCGLKLFKNLIIRNLSGRAMSELFELWPACSHTVGQNPIEKCNFGKPHCLLQMPNSPGPLTDP